MEKNLTSWYSHRVEKEMPVAVYGHYGFVLLLVPTAAADYLEYERFGLIDTIRPHIEGGKVKVYSVNSINNDSWLNNNVHPKHKTWMHNQFNHYIYDEVVPYIKATSGYDTPIIISGASFGALH
ncbi:MAG: esterase, partial [Chitinophagaceae bacterium]